MMAKHKDEQHRRTPFSHDHLLVELCILELVGREEPFQVTTDYLN